MSKSFVPTLLLFQAAMFSLMLPFQLFHSIYRQMNAYTHSNILPKQQLTMCYTILQHPISTSHILNNLLVPHSLKLFMLVFPHMYIKYLDIIKPFIIISCHPTFPSVTNL